MPYTTTAYTCLYCSATFDFEEDANIHEEHCSHNPMNQELDEGDEQYLTESDSY